MNAKVLAGVATTAIVTYVGLFFLNALFVQLCFNHLREQLGLQVGEMDYWDAMVAQILVLVLRGTSFSLGFLDSSQKDSSQRTPSYASRSRRLS